MLTTVGATVYGTHPVASGWQALNRPFRMYEASTALLFGGLTIVLLVRLALEQKLAAALLVGVDPDQGR